jgi:hypothetical protein
VLAISAPPEKIPTENTLLYTHFEVFFPLVFFGGSDGLFVSIHDRPYAKRSIHSDSMGSCSHSD